MKILTTTLSLVLLAPAAFADDMKHMEGMHMDDKSMKDMPMEHQKAQTVSASGQVKKVDRERGTITIAHGPVDALKWPAMVMPFKASAQQMQKVSQGDEVEFEFTSSGMTSTLTSINKR